MSSNNFNPAAILYDSNGNAVGVSGTMALPTGAIGILQAAIDNGNTVRYLTTTSGALNVSLTVGTGSAGIANNISGAAVSVRAYDGRNEHTIVEPYPEYVLGVVLRGSHSSGSREAGSQDHPIVVDHTELARSGFGELRTTTSKTLFDNTNKYEINQYELSITGTNGGTVTYISASGNIRLAVTNASGSYAAVRSNTWFRYQSGRGQLIRMSGFNNDAGQANQLRSWGYFDDYDGLFFRQNGTIMEIVVRSSTAGGVPVETSVSQSQWNVDTLTGTGHDGVILDPQKGNIYEISAQWLGSGIIRWFVSERLVHITDFRNAITNVPYMRTAMLPVTCEIRNQAAISSTTGSIDNTCFAVFTEGGQQPDPQLTFSAANPADINVSTTEVPIISIEPKATYAGQTNRMIILPTLANCNNNGFRVRFRVVLNMTLTSPSWVSADPASGVEYDVSAVSGSGGITLYNGLLPGTTDSQDIDLTRYFDLIGRKLRMNAFGTGRDKLTIMAAKESGGSTVAVRGGLNWNEIR